LLARHIKAVFQQKHKYDEKSSHVRSCLDIIREWARSREALLALEGNEKKYMVKFSMAYAPALAANGSFLKILAMDAAFGIHVHASCCFGL